MACKHETAKACYILSPHATERTIGLPFQLGSTVIGALSVHLPFVDSSCHSSPCCQRVCPGSPKPYLSLIPGRCFSAVFSFSRYRIWRAWGGGDTQCAGGPLGRRYSPLLFSLGYGVTGTVGAHSSFIGSEGPPASEVIVRSLALPPARPRFCFSLR